jgi:hypothetical protein
MDTIEVANRDSSGGKVIRQVVNCGVELHAVG